ncbi:hypothetical protein XENOCAPTIV_018258 [Xenoophorus captivus]|uniref:Uncharacterized protein n=1 Tax=Xenoophorus captivus TaxID=1517983 RepID=A0ABV0Q5F5_9TELE
MCSAADGRGRERQRESTSTLEVPEQQRTPSHHIRSRSVSPHREEQGRTIRSRAPNVPTQRSLDDELPHSRRSRSPNRYCDNSRGRRQGEEYLDDSDLQPSLDRVKSASANCLTPDNHAPSSQTARGHLHSGASLSSAAAASAARRVRQLPQLPPQSSSVEQALVAEERVRQLQMRVHSNRISAATTSSQQDLDRAVKNKREVSNKCCVLLHHRSSENNLLFHTASIPRS